MSAIKIKIAENETEISQAKDVRRKVFQVEQGIDANLDFDGNDDNADHIIAYTDENVVGTTRLRFLSDGIVKLERLAVVKEQQKNGIGKEIILYTLQYLQGKGVKKLILDSQEHAKGFYEKFSFKQDGDVFEEVGIPHVKMVRDFIIVGGKYRNWKTGNLYKVIGIGKHSETLEDLVFYEALYDNQMSKFWARPIGMFLEEVTLSDGTKKQRFALVGE